MRVYFTLDLDVSEETLTPSKILDATNIAFDDTDPRNTECVVNRITLPPGAADTPIDLGDITTTTMILIVAYSDITFKINDMTQSAALVTTPAVGSGALSPLQKESRPGVFVCRGALASMTVSNLSMTTPARILTAVIGRLTA